MNIENFDTLFNKFIESNTSDSIMQSFEKLLKLINIDPNSYSNEVKTRLIYKIFQTKTNNWKLKDLFKLFDDKSKLNVYNSQNPIKMLKVLIIGGGPVGLRLSIECALLGFETIIIEKRQNFSRNNILHLWPYTVYDLKSLGAKFFYGKFCTGSIDHISTRTLQCILLKSALLLGVKVYFNTSFESVSEPGQGWGVKCSPIHHPINSQFFHAIVGANGKKICLPGFKKNDSKNRISIGITANFINNKTRQEVDIKEISGFSYLYQKKFFDELNMGLENLVYYKEDTHYLVMTANRDSLIKYKVFKREYSNGTLLLSKSNILLENLYNFVKKVGTFCQIPRLEFATNGSGRPDVSIFDFSSISQAEYSSRIFNYKDKKLLLALVGDCLLEPFWPMGTGIGRGFLSAMDTAWQLKQFSSNQNYIDIIYEREKFYQILSQIRNDSLKKNYASFTIDPTTRYFSFNTKLEISNVIQLYDNSKPDFSHSKIFITPQLKRSRNFENSEMQKRQKLDENVLMDKSIEKFENKIKFSKRLVSTPIVRESKREIDHKNEHNSNSKSCICFKCRNYVIKEDRLTLFDNIVFHIKCYNSQTCSSNEFNGEFFSNDKFWLWFFSPLEH